MKAPAVAIRFLILLFSVVFSSVGFSKNLEALPENLVPVYHQLRSQLLIAPVNYKTEGVVCEQLSVLHFQSLYPVDKYFVESGVEYSSAGQTIGELDLVVSEKDSGRVVLVGEVKCWKSLDEAMDKAKLQRDRFLWSLQSKSTELVFKSKSQVRTYSVQDFQAVDSYLFVSQIGGKKWGFNLELPYLLWQLDLLQEHLVKFQKNEQRGFN